MSKGKVTQGWHTGCEIAEKDLKFSNGKFTESFPIVYVGKGLDFICLTANTVERVEARTKDQRGKAALGGYLLGGALTAAAGYALGGDLLYGLEVYYKNGKADLIENIDADAYKHIINCINKRIVVPETSYDKHFPYQRQVEERKIQDMYNEVSKAQSSGDHDRAAFFLEKLIDTKKNKNKKEDEGMVIIIGSFLFAVFFLVCSIAGAGGEYILFAVAFGIAGVYLFNKRSKNNNEIERLKTELEKEKNLQNKTK